MEKLILERVAIGDIEDSSVAAEELKVEHQALLGVVQSLWTDGFLTMEASSRSWLSPTPEGEDILRNGSPEYRIYCAVRDGTEVPSDKFGFNAAMKKGWVKFVKEEGKKKKLVLGTEPKTDTTREALQELREERELITRKLATRVTLKYFKIGRGPNFAMRRVKKVGDISAETLKNWETVEFKDYNFRTLGERVSGGYVQPLLKVRAEFRKILMGMGFEEMETNLWVESSFWNFDALFQPQSHPARDAHDTFFVKDPPRTLEWPADYYERVREMHEKGGAGSIGHRSPFDDAEARKNLLRTHTTAVSARMLYQLARTKPFKPARYFSIDRVFRNESMDSTHLCEFHQVEGLVADYDLSLGNLISTIRTFFAKIGITQLRFKPAFNPYTEPSMEVFGYHPDLKKWTEIGNSGMFRPEMLAPMGLPPNVKVIAWGLSLERPTMIKYRISNIRDLFGHKADLNRTKATPMCIFP
ncbi:hypothetical protein CTAYLR_003780 [Chrysophaeum taylorii]|uniref:phenylalanine--tRNA ligase n=1 Tax=Chrysophaeum taylorii TaxID=2483200 RepID=A0AAD7XKD7_9STRA|nr:hypothetical protein CTAYLR_003780 [Chrysophaeum taylorii]